MRGDTFPNAEVVLLDEGLQGTLLFDYRTTGGRHTGPVRLFGAHAEEPLSRFESSVPLTGGRFSAPNPACAVTMGQ